MYNSYVKVELYDAVNDIYFNNNHFYKMSIGPYHRKEYVSKLQETINFIGIKGTKIVKNEN